MRLHIVGHPARRMRQRKVTGADIENAIRHHHTSVSTRPDSITYIGPGMSGQDLKVWVLPPGYADEDTTITVKSAAWRNREDPA